MAYPFNYNLPTPAGDGKFNFQPPTINPFDQVIVDEKPIPGISKVSITRDRKTNIQKRRQGNGDRTTDSGADLATIRVTTRIFFEPQYQQMADFLSYIENQLNRLPNSTSEEGFKIEHPDLTLRNIRTVLVTSIEGPTHYMPPGYSEYSFSFKEVRAKGKANTKTQEPSKQGSIETTTPLNPDFGGQQPSKDKGLTGPKRGKLPKKT